MGVPPHGRYGARRPPRRRYLAGDRRAVRHEAARRLRRARHQGRAAGRRLQPPPRAVSRTTSRTPRSPGLYLHLNTSKRSMTLDVSVPSGQVVLKKLLANADVFVAGERTSTLRAWGLTYDDLKAEFPDLIVAQVSPFGATGPYADYDGNSLTAMAMSTIMYNTGEPDREPLVDRRRARRVHRRRPRSGSASSRRSRTARRAAAATTSTLSMAEAVAGAGRVQRGDVRLPGRDPAALLLAPHLRLPERHHGLRRRPRRRDPRRGGLPVAARRPTPSRRWRCCSRTSSSTRTRCSSRWASA